MRIIHLSDLHVGYKDCGNKFRAIIDSISLKMYPLQDFVVVITGDLADNANRPGQREEAARAV